MTEETNQSPIPQIDLLTKGELISLAVAAKKAGLTPKYLRDIAEKGRLQAKKIGRDWVTTEAAVEEYLKTRKFVYPKGKTS